MVAERIAQMTAVDKSLLLDSVKRFVIPIRLNIGMEQDP
jgi:hypothetical protein